jgi:peptide/nickel transport system substrate-binding protein
MRTAFPKRLALAAAVATSTALVLAACSGGSDTPDAGGGDESHTIRASQLLAPASFDPAQPIAGPQYNYVAAAYETLVFAEPDGTLEPGIATSWEYASPTQLDLVLREDVTFSDETGLDAELVKANLERYQSTPGPWQSRLNSIASIEVTGDYALSLMLNTSDPSLPQALSVAPGMMVSQAAIDDPESLIEAPAGSGPWVYVPDESTAGSEYVYTATDTYSGPIEVGFDRIEFVILPDTTAQLNALLAGDIDLGSAQYTQRDTAEAQGMAATGMLMNVSGLWLFDRAGSLAPELADVRVRQAINYALDRDAIAAALWGEYQQPTAQIFGSDSSAYDEALDEAYPYDPEMAQELLAEAGYADGFTLRIATRQTYGDAARTEAIAPYLEEVGITVEIADQTNDYDAVVGAGEFPVAQGQAQTFESYVVASQFLFANGQFNPLHTEDAELTALIDTAANELDPAAAAEAWQAVNQWVVDEAWFAPVAFYGIHAIWNPEVLDTEMTVGIPIPLPYEWVPAE